ncbi:hypothetical protein CKM354_000812100 [Cercospora kikuchii]|uniref:Uncharacterized protein n=1 Tax=Cercospora kikuchii TaxID=84275 RepID=A0A9P3CKL8_9PEZI|nr:uncharacterized protein CKM354_000812100 [Cercospora kikuchii]GIZ44937.1 hypothetical protein CKM354_000812100 [Cercospora kikuchii]
MSTITLPTEFPALAGKTVVITGGASGIGEGYVRVARDHGANVVFGDRDQALGNQVAAAHGATFVPTDVTSYADQLKLFATAFQKYGRVDHAIANAAVYEPNSWFSETADLESVQKEPPSLVYDINVRGVTTFSHIASVYLRQGVTSPTNDDKSLTIVSSTAGIHVAHKTPLYGTSKAAINYLGRALSKTLPTTHGIRVNVICPSITRTPLGVATHMVKMFEDADIPVQSSEDVGNVIAAINSDPSMNGKTLYVHAGKAYDLRLDSPAVQTEVLGLEILETMGKLAKRYQRSS